MNILFLLKSLDIGGLEVVTSVLANKFVSEGHNVTVFSFNKSTNSIENRLNKKIYICSQEEYSCNKDNINTLRKALVERQIDIIINQWGLPYLPIMVAHKAAKGLNIKFISIHHNDPSANGKIFDCNISIDQSKKKTTKTLLRFKRIIIKYITSRSMRYVYNHSDLYQVLSPSFIERFKTFTGIKNPKKLMVQTNPVTIDADDFVFNPTKKRKEILYVGRIDYNQKRVYRVIDIWSQLEKKFPDWYLTIVGDGVERKSIERKATELGLKHVSFEGFQSPKPYYQCAKILLLTSEYEGFPLVLAECMSFGVVPAVYGSYSAVYDIIDNGTNGIIFPYNKNGFSAVQAAKEMELIMTDETIYRNMAEKAIETSKKYSIDEIYKSWEQTFNQLCK